MHVKHQKEIKRFIADGDFEVTDGGILVHSAAMIRGRYITSVNGKDEEVSPNLLPSQGILYILGAAFDDEVAAIDAWYLAPYSGAVSPQSTWTAANFTATATEITSGTEGYSNATRPQWTPTAAAAGVISSTTARATFTITCTTSINISGIGLLSSNVKGGTSGILASATRYDNVRVVNNGDAFEVGYEVELTDS
jgi:hypothetical protein